MKIFCIGQNYASHNQEMQYTHQNADPVVFMKPDTALLKNGNPFFLPNFSTQIEYETELVVRINRLGKNISERFAHRYYEEITVGIDLTARDIQRKMKDNGLPWELAKGFDNSAVLGTFISKNEIEDWHNLPFHLDINGKTVQTGNTKEMIHSVDTIIAYISRFFTLKIGDILFTGTPVGVGLVAINDHLEGYLDNKKLLSFHIK